MDKIKFLINAFGKAKEIDRLMITDNFIFLMGSRKTSLYYILNYLEKK